MWICICDKCGKRITGETFVIAYTRLVKSIFRENNKMLINMDAKKELCEECFREVERVMTFIKGEESK